MKRFFPSLFRTRMLYCPFSSSQGLRVGSSVIFSARNISSTGNGSDSRKFVDDDESLRGELESALESEQERGISESLFTPKVFSQSDPSSPGEDGAGAEMISVQLEKLDRPPARFDLITNSFVYRWCTTAACARKVSGPMREWAAELKYRTGVHLEIEPTFPDRLLREKENGGYSEADEVDITVYVFGSERGVFNCRKLMEAAVQLDPSYVRLGVFRRVPDSEEVEWLMLRRINRELRPPDIPPISLKLPGKWTLLYENYKEAAIRTLWEETGITVDPANVYPTGQLHQSLPQYYWRVPVRYFIAEVPYDVKVAGPQIVPAQYMRHWDSRLLRQSPDPIDRVWSQVADPETGCAWMKTSMVDELQKPLRGDYYMAIRYTPPPYSNLTDVVRLDIVPAVSKKGERDDILDGEEATTDSGEPATNSEEETKTS